MPKNSGSMPKCGSSGRKIGTKMMMISDHSSGQPSRKMMSCARIRNCSGDRSRPVTNSRDHLLAAEIGEHRGEGPGADEQPADHRRGAHRQIDAIRAAAARSARGRRRPAPGRRARRSAAASDGVARPNRIAPSTARIRNASGKNEVSSMPGRSADRDVAAPRPRSASVRACGCSMARPMT